MSINGLKQIENGRQIYTSWSCVMFWPCKSKTLNLLQRILTWRSENIYVEFCSMMSTGYARLHLHMTYLICQSWHIIFEHTVQSNACIECKIRKWWPNLWNRPTIQLKTPLLARLTFLFQYFLSSHEWLSVPSWKWFTGHWRTLAF